MFGVLGAASVATATAAGALLAPGDAAPADAAGSRPRRRVPDDLKPGGSLDRFVADLAARDEFSGNLLLTQRGRAVLERSYGLANKDLATDIGPDTAFALASVNKLFTAVAVTQLAQQGKVRFWERLGTYVDGFPPEIADKVTVHQLLTHTSGLDDHMRLPGFEAAARSWTTPDEVMDGHLEFIRRLTLLFPPGAGQAYSNAGFHLVGEIVARASGQSYYDYVREHVFLPAGMTGTAFYTQPQWRDDRGIAHPYERQPSGERKDVVEEKPFMGSPSGDSFSTVSDLVRFTRALQADRQDERLLTPGYRAVLLGGKLLMRPPRHIPAEVRPQEVAQCYGWISELRNDHWGFFHGGGSPGVSTFIGMHPDQDLTLAILSNYGHDAARPISEMAQPLITAG